ncbi:MAG: class I SAM-dependent methyltransferase [Armatimonadota bacterium]
MFNDATAFSELSAKLAAYVVEYGGDLQRYVVVPALFDMLGGLAGKHVLDLYCGAGYLSRRLVTLGARVTAVDTSSRLIDIANEVNDRENQSIRYVVVESNDLSALEDGAFDDIVCNMGLMFVRDLPGTVAELARLVKLGGRFVFSVLHPCFYMPSSCWMSDEDSKLLYRIVDNYYAEGWYLPDVPAGVRSRTAKIKHRTLAAYINALSARGFNVRRVAEPKPAHEVTSVKPHLEIFARIPAVLIVEAIFPYI